MSDPRERALTVEQLNTYIKDYLNTSPLLQRFMSRARYQMSVFTAVRGIFISP